jgi:hypothetical protein
MQNCDETGNSAITGNYLKEYYQTKGNDPQIDAVHDHVAGFTPLKLDDQIPDQGTLTEAKAASYHDAANVIGIQHMFEDVKWCMENC